MDSKGEKGKGMQVESLVGAKEAADLMHCSPQTIKRYAERGEVPAMRMGNRWMFLPSLLDEWRKKQLLSNCSKQ